MKKTFCYVALILVLISCKKDSVDVEVQYAISPEFTVYVNKFYEEAASRGITIAKENLIVKANLNLGQTDICGKCKQNAQYPTLQRTVEINTESLACWKSMPENNREALVFHELGHCLLGRLLHKDDLFNDGSPKSIMISSNSDLYSPCAYVFDEKPELCNKTGRRKYYIDELFDENTPAPDWSK